MFMLFTFRRAATLIILLFSTAALPALADDALPTVDLSAQGRAQAANDMATAEAYFESTGAKPAEVAKTVNRAISEALEMAKKHPSVKVQTSGTSTWPVYAKNSQSITAWRMRASLSLESRDMAALSALIGTLQNTLAIGNLSLQPAPETVEKAGETATVAAIAAFRQRANLVADTLGKSYRIKHLNIGTQGGPQPIFRARAMSSDMAMGAAEAAPIEAGDTRIEIQVNGTIELTD